MEYYDYFIIQNLDYCFSFKYENYGVIYHDFHLMTIMFNLNYF
jgi:hypothetical protein